MSDDYPVCADCKHFRPSSMWFADRKMHKCAAKQHQDLITGNRWLPSAWSMRNGYAVVGTEAECGISGKLFERKRSA